MICTQINLDFRFEGRDFYRISHAFGMFARDDKNFSSYFLKDVEKLFLDSNRLYEYLNVLVLLEEIRISYDFAKKTYGCGTRGSVGDCRGPPKVQHHFEDDFSQQHFEMNFDNFNQSAD